MTQFKYITVDVFTSEAFKGNPLAVFPDATNIPEQMLQKIAKEFNYSETTFVFPPANSEHTAKVRIFTPTNEVPFAGHPNIGTAFVLAQQETVFGKSVKNKMIFEEQVGLVYIDITQENNKVVGAQFSIDNNLIVSSQIELGDISNCANVNLNKIITDNHLPVIASVGLPFAFVEVDSINTLNSTSADLAACLKAENKYECLNDHFALFLYTRTSESNQKLEIRSRMFAPINNIIEDPATGSASAALTSYLLEYVYPNLNELNIHFIQGEKMGRESHIFTSASKHSNEQNGKITVSGKCISIMQGEISLAL